MTPGKWPSLRQVGQGQPLSMVRGTPLPPLVPARWVVSPSQCRRMMVAIPGPLSEVRTHRAVDHRFQCFLAVAGDVFDPSDARGLASGDGSALKILDRARSMYLDGVSDSDSAWAWWIEETEISAQYTGALGELGLHDKSQTQRRPPKFRTSHDSSPKDSSSTNPVIAHETTVRRPQLANAQGTSVPLMTVVVLAASCRHHAGRSPMSDEHDTTRGGDTASARVHTLCHNCGGARYTVTSVYAVVNGVGRTVPTQRPCPYCDQQGILDGVIPPV